MDKFITRTGGKKRPAAEAMTPTDEQQAIIDAFCIGKHNVIVNACAGAGKTTLAGFVAQNLPTDVLLLTYNNHLAANTRESASSRGISNLTAMTIHSWIGKAYGSRNNMNDIGLYETIEADTPLKPEQSHYKYVILDEVQDMSPTLFLIVHKTLRDLKRPQILVLGDERQMIYGHLNADSRYLNAADRVFGLVCAAYPFKRLSIKTSQRVPQVICEFMNYCIGSDVIHPSPFNDFPGKLNYYNGDDTKTLDIFYEELSSLVASGVAHEKIAILMHSTGSNHHVKEFVNNIKTQFKNKVNFFVTNSDRNVEDPRVRANKVLILTQHGSKGLEFDHVILVNFDRWRNYMNHRECETGLSNILYVAATRARKTLSIYVNERMFQDILPLQRGRMRAFAASRPATVSYRVFPCRRWSYSPPKYETNAMNPDIVISQATKHMSSIAIREVRKMLEYVAQRPATYSIDIPSVVASDTSIVESVSHLTGISMTGIQEFMLTGDCKTIRAIAGAETDDHFNAPVPIVENGQLNVQNLLKHCNVLDSIFSGYNHILWQIPAYNWMDESIEQIKTSIRALNLRAEDGWCYEQRVCKSYNAFKFSGVMDLCNETNVIELKFKNQLADEDFVQTALYLWVSNKQTAVLYNIRTGEAYQLRHNHNTLQKAVDKFLELKGRNSNELTDDEFFELVADRLANPRAPTSEAFAMEFDDEPPTPKPKMLPIRTFKF